MSTQQQPLRSRREARSRIRKNARISLRVLLITMTVSVTLIITVLVVLSTLGIISTALAAITSTMAGVLAAVFAFLALIPKEESRSPTNLSLPIKESPTSPSNPSSCHIAPVFLPPTESQTIQQRRKLVEEVYAKLAQPNLSAVALTGIGGVGKSTLAALTYRYVEEQYFNQRGKFATPPLWLTIDRNTTFADLVDKLSQLLGKPVMDLQRLTPQDQVAVLFTLLNTIDKPCLLILDQFENLLDWETGHARPDRPGVGEWVDILNSQLYTSGSRVLLTSRLLPKGTHECPLRYIEEFSVGGLEIAEGVDLLRKSGIQAAENDLQSAVEFCRGHPFALTLLATLLHDYGSSLSAMLKSPMLWEDNIANNLLDFIYRQQLGKEKRALLLALSVYRIPVPLEAALALTTQRLKPQLLPALKVLLMQHIVEAVSDDHYQLHSIVANYAMKHINERSKKLNDEALRHLYAKAAQYYLQQFIASRSSWQERGEISDFQPLIEAVWHYCQAARWQEAYNLMEREDIFNELNRRGGDAILLELYQLLLPLSRWEPESSVAASIYHELGWICNDLGRMQAAQTYYEQELSIRKDRGDRKEEASALCSIGLVYDNIGKHQQALDCYQRALSIQRDIGDRKEEAVTLNNMGNLYDDLNDSQQALNCLQRALDFYREVGDRHGEGVALNNLGSVYSSLGDEQQALAHYQQALLIRREVRDYNGEGTTLSNIGLTFDELGDEQQAIDYFRQALSIQRKVGDRRGEGYILRNIGTLYFEQNRYYTSLAALLLAKDVFEEVLSPEGDQVQRWIDELNEIVGGEVFHALLMQVEPQAHEIVEQALSIGL